MPYTQGEQVAATIGDAIADGPLEVKAGTVTKTTSQTTAVVTHGFSGTPDFVIFSLQPDAGSQAGATFTANGTSITFSKTTAETNWSVAYIAGYTA